MDIQFFEIRFFEIQFHEKPCKTMKHMKNIWKTMTTKKNHIFAYPISHSILSFENIEERQGNIEERPIIDAHGFPWFPMGTLGFPWYPWGSPWVPMRSPWGPHGSPWASMENPRMSEIIDFNENHYSVRQKIGEPGSKSIRNVFPLLPVTSKRPESPYGQLLDNFCRKSSFFSFSAYWTPIGPLLDFD